MERRPPRRSERRCSPERLLLFLAVLSVLALGPALGGVAVWIHDHGHAGGHAHFVPAQTDRAELFDLHESQHRKGHENGSHDEHEDDEPAPDGLLIELPHALAAAPRGPSLAAATGILLSALLPAPSWHLAINERPQRPDLCRSAWPPQRTQRSAVAELLRSSHALLI